MNKDGKNMEKHSAAAGNESGAAGEAEQPGAKSWISAFRAAAWL